MKVKSEKLPNFLKKCVSYSWFIITAILIGFGFISKISRESSVTIKIIFMILFIVDIIYGFCLLCAYSECDKPNEITGPMRDFIDKKFDTSIGKTIKIKNTVINIECDYKDIDRYLYNTMYTDYHTRKLDYIKNHIDDIYKKYMDVINKDYNFLYNDYLYKITDVMCKQISNNIKCFNFSDIAKDKNVILLKNIDELLNNYFKLLNNIKLELEKIKCDEISVENLVNQKDDMINIMNNYQKDFSINGGK